MKPLEFRQLWESLPAEEKRQLGTVMAMMSMAVMIENADTLVKFMHKYLASMRELLGMLQEQDYSI